MRYHERSSEHSMEPLNPEQRARRKIDAQPLSRHQLFQPQDPGTGINAVIGKWPGDESEEEFLAALAEMS
jgi:hypothetical protein